MNIKMEIRSFVWEYLFFYLKMFRCANRLTSLIVPIDIDWICLSFQIKHWFEVHLDERYDQITSSHIQILSKRRFSSCGVIDIFVALTKCQLTRTWTNKEWEKKCKVLILMALFNSSRSMFDDRSFWNISNKIFFFWSNFCSN